MAHFYVNTNAQANGDHEVHEQGCSFMPHASNRIYLGDFTNCHAAVREAQKTYRTANGCYYCARPCNTG